MKYNFYWNYTIDDANADCWRIIVNDCWNNHKYATLCELVAECPEMKQLTKPCIVDFLNDPSASKYTHGLSSDKWFVRVNASGCLELADPCMCSNWDKYVVASDEDNSPWPLDEKVKLSCSYDGIYCIDIEEAWPQTLVWRPSGPNGPFINPQMPTSECGDWWYYVMLWKTWSNRQVQYQCNKSNKPQYAKCVYLWWPWLAHTSAKDRTVRYVVPWYTGYKPIDSWADDAVWYIDWDWDVRWTEFFSKPKSSWVITINTPWVYEVAFSTYITFWQVLHSIRCGIWYDSWSWAKEINDIKYQCWEYWDWTGNAVFNRTFPDDWDEAKFRQNEWYWTHWAWWTLDNTWLPFARTYILNVVNETELFMMVKPDMRWVDPRLIPAFDKDDRYRIAVSWSADWNPYNAATTIEISRLSDAVREDRLRPLN